VMRATQASLFFSALHCSAMAVLLGLGTSTTCRLSIKQSQVMWLATATGGIQFCCWGWARPQTCASPQRHTGMLYGSPLAPPKQAAAAATPALTCRVSAHTWRCGRTYMQLHSTASATHNASLAGYLSKHASPNYESRLSPALARTRLK
jgi:hypothetical protein